MKIDFHYHYADKEGFVEGLLKEMDASNVDITLLMGGPEEAFWEYMNCRFAPNEKPGCWKFREFLFFVSST